MRLHTLLDLHLRDSFIDIPPVESNSLILTGDIPTPGQRAFGWAVPETVRFGCVVVQVVGNHELCKETLKAERALMRKAVRRPRLYLLDRASVVLARVRILGCVLWTDYRVPIIDAMSYDMRVDLEWGMAVCAVILTDHRCIEWQDGADSRLSTSKDLLGEQHAVRQWLEQQLAVLSDGPTVVVTHHVLHALSVAPRFASDWVTCGFASALPDSFFVVPALWIHGHTHTRFDYRVGNYRIVCNPQGYAMWGGDFEVDDFEPVFVIEVSP